MIEALFWVYIAVTYKNYNAKYCLFIYNGINIYTLLLMIIYRVANSYK